jgi:Inner membrane protein YgaP-like, transmembrane domain
MNTAKWHLFHHPNVGNTDKLVRFVVGAALIGSIFVITSAQFGWITLLPLIAIPIVISAIMGWDPIYAMFHKQPTPRLLSLDTMPTAVASPQGAAPDQVVREAA